MIVLGLDPGTRNFGWAVVAREGTRLRYCAHGTIRAGTGDALAPRLVVIERELSAVIDEHRPTAASIESIFFDKNAQSAAKLGHARGVALLVCGRANLDIGEYAPALVKRAIGGTGRAEKEQVAQMVRVMLGLTQLPRGDGADALAIAITHLHRAPLLVSNAAPSPYKALITRLGAARRNIPRRSPV